MVKRKRIYICDHCGAVGVETTYSFYGDVFKGPPDGWTKLGSEDLCPVCTETYERFNSEVLKENNNAGYFCGLV